MLLMINGTAKALSPVVHAGDRSGGTLTPFRRVKVVVDNRVEYLPILSGNSVRGILRDYCAEFSLRAAGLSSIRTMSVYHLLFSGGALRGAGSESHVNLVEEKRLRELLPALSLFGGSLGNRVLGGKLYCAEWVPLCRELAFMVPDEFHPLAKLFSIYDLIDIISFTRRDDAKSRRFQKYVDQDTLQLYMQSKETKSEADEAEDPGEAAQMRYHMECLAPGTQFYVEFVLEDASDVEMGTFLGGLGLFARRPAVGGRSSSGLGRIELNLKQVEISAPMRITSELSLEAVDKAKEYLYEHRAELAELLEVLSGV